ncbi:MAG: hypothetical protein QM373_08880 [Bacillota bacterium]|jgi:hypothetical protein|nr:hypothetical protein [Bacillota bacterium]
MRMRTIICMLLLLLVMTAPAFAVNMPTRLSEIPVYPGAVRDPESEQARLEYTYVPDDVVFHALRVYRIEDTYVDDPARFYLDFFQPELGWPDTDPYTLEPGESLGPWHELGFWETPRIFENQYEFDTLIQDGKWIRQAFEKRPQWEEGKWLSGASFYWEMVNDDYELLSFALHLTDMGYDSREKVDHKTTELVIEMTVTELPDWEDWDDIDIDWEALWNRNWDDIEWDDDRDDG